MGEWLREGVAVDCWAVWLCLEAEPSLCHQEREEMEEALREKDAKVNYQFEDSQAQMGMSSGTDVGRHSARVLSLRASLCRHPHHDPISTR